MDKSRLSPPPPHIIQQYAIGPGDEAIQPFDKLRILHLNPLNAPPPPESFDYILTNPPFGTGVEKSQVSPTLRKSGRTEFLFTDLVMKSLKPGGRAAIIVPGGILYNGQHAPKAIRRELVEDNRLEAIITLPGNIFERLPRPKRPSKKSKNGIQTHILLFTKGGLTETISFYTIKAATPESLDALGRLLQGEAVEDPNLTAWSASREDVAENDYNLAPRRYEPYEPPPPGPPLEELWADMELAEEELAIVQAGLRDMMTGILDFDEVERLKDDARPSGAGDTLAAIEAESHQTMDDLSAALKPALSVTDTSTSLSTSVASLRETMNGVVDFEEVERLKAQKQLEIPGA